MNTATLATPLPRPSAPPRFRVLPGFRLTLGYTLAYLSLLVLIPLAAVFLKTAELSLAEFWNVVTAPRVVASYKLSFGMSLLAAAINAVFGLMLAWALVRYSFPGKKLIDALVDLPFALPTAVAGIALTALYAKNGWIGQFLEPLDIQVAFKPLGVLVRWCSSACPSWCARCSRSSRTSTPNWKKPPPASAHSAGRPSAT